MQAITKTKIPWMDDGYATNPYKGCLHQCNWDGAACWAAEIARRYKKGDHSIPTVKDNYLSHLEKEAARKSPGNILISNTCDPYQPLESTNYLTRHALQCLTEYGWTPIILTKSTLARRDFPQLIGSDAWFGMSLTDPEWTSIYEQASSFKERISCLKAAKAEGINTWISWEPIPAYNSDQLQQVFKIIHNIKPDFVIFGSLNRAGHPAGNYAAMASDLAGQWQRRFPEIPVYFKSEILSQMHVDARDAIIEMNTVPWLEKAR